ncbi:hypothetical protein YPPY59_2949, partial [Yersinia pestis PY-59]
MTSKTLLSDFLYLIGALSISLRIRSCNLLR